MARVVWTVPLFIGGSVASLWILGALVKAAQLREAGIPAMDALPIVPLEQLLALGVGAILDALPLVLIFVVSVLAGMVTTIARLNWGRKPNTPRSQPQRRDYVLPVVLVLAISTSVSFIIAYGVTLVMGLIIARPRVKRLHETSGSTVVIIISAIVVISAVVDYVVTPNPLPTASLKLEDGNTLTGPLVANAGSTWFVVTGDDQFEVIAARRVRVARIEHVSRPDPPRLRTYMSDVFGWIS